METLLKNKFHDMPGLIEGCKRGERKAQEKLYHLFAPKMLAVTIRYAKDTMEAEDMLMLGFTKIFEKIATYSGSGSIEGWIRKVIVNSSITLYRQNATRIKTHWGEPKILEALMPGCIQTDIDYLLQALRSLPDFLNQPFNMFAIEGYTHREIAEILGISEELSKVRVFRARETLRERLKIRENRVNRIYTAA